MAPGSAGPFAPSIPPPGGVPPAGDRLGVSLPRILEILNTPKLKLYCRIGNDLVIESPERFSDGTELSCDPANGPVTDARVMQIVNDTSAFVRFKVVTCISDSDHFILSNVWSMTDDVDAVGYTTRTVRGRAVFRADYLRLFGLTPDNFRQYLFVPTCPTMRRAKIYAEVSEDNCTLDYAVVDHETTYGTGGNARVLQIEGTATAGCHIAIKDMKQAANILIPAAYEFATGKTGLLDVAKLVWNAGVPNSMCSALVRVTGQKGADPRQLAAVAMLAAAAKFGKNWLLGVTVIVGAYLTVPLGSEDEPWVELRVELLGNANLSFLFDPSVAYSMLKLEVVGIEELDMTAGRARQPLGGSNNSRGSFIRSMVLQALTPPGALPALPAAADDLPDLSTYI
jgi:hypothetical protein